MKKPILILALLISFSCSEEVLTNENLVNTEELSTLIFKDGSEMLSYIKDVSEQEGAVVNARSANNNFESFDEIYKRVLEQLDQTKSVEEHDSILKANSDVVSLLDSSYVPKLDNYLYRTICNRQGLYESGGYIHKVFDNQYIVYTDIKNRNALKQVISLDNLDPAIFKIRKYQDFNFEQNNGRVLGDCGQSQQAVYFKNSSGCSDDRRVYIRAYTSYAISGNTYTANVISEAYGKIRNWLCNWNPYKTILRTRNCSFDVHIRINQINDHYPFYFTDQSPTDERWNIVLIQGPISNPIVWTGGVIPAISFSRIHLEATSRGVGFTNWAIIDCQ